ncbi:hypothetical protein AQ490_05065 [Wenjunlia vitaminophila]|uniref:ANTAR domain-containing protein n=1 Tax=Wenjunlia vitaminophila TaxID=76728 RepID=A0A0T6LNW9_WENVI|nr:GAF and ANTAR domain-containing protein [Wenjunlia vitaminophila]KRV47750.1 hypothetical protein AQ490_05065 [Wenjunlia vitaminophila]
MAEGEAGTPRELRLAQAFVELAGAPLDVSNPLPTLERLTRGCVELVGATAAGVVVWDGGRGAPVVAASNGGGWLPRLLRERPEQGPCTRCLHAGEVVCWPDHEDHRARWPRYAERAEAAGVRASYAVPLRADGEALGVLGLFLDHPGPLADHRVRLAVALADTASAALLRQRALRQSELLVGQLQTALHSRIVVEQAKGVLAERWGVTVGEAFETLRGYARAHNERVAEVSRAIVMGGIATDHMRPGRRQPGSGGGR